MTFRRATAALLLALTSACGSLHLCEGPEEPGVASLRVPRGAPCPGVDQAASRLVGGHLRRVTGFNGQSDVPGHLVCVYPVHTLLPAYDGVSEVYYFASKSEACASPDTVEHDRAHYPLGPEASPYDVHTLWGAPRGTMLVAVVGGPTRAAGSPDKCVYQVAVHRDETHPAVDARIEVDFAEGEIDVARCPAPTAVQKDARAAAGEDATVEAIDAPTVSSASEPPGTECRYEVVYRDDADHCG